MYALALAYLELFFLKGYFLVFMVTGASGFPGEWNLLEPAVGYYIVPAAGPFRTHIGLGALCLRVRRRPHPGIFLWVREERPEHKGSAPDTGHVDPVLQGAAPLVVLETVQGVFFRFLRYPLQDNPPEGIVPRIHPVG